MRRFLILSTILMIILFPAAVFAEFTPEIIENAKSAIVVIYDGDILMGSGFFIDSLGTILTNRHVILGGQYLWALLFNGKNIKLELLWADGDLALLKPVDKNDRKFPFLEFEKENNLNIGQAVAAIGHGGGFWQVIRGTIKGWRSNLKVQSVSSAYNFNAITYSPTILTYFSGGPLLDKNGFVVGINSASDKLDKSVNYDNFFSYAIPANDIKSFISDFDRMSLLVQSIASKSPKLSKKTDCEWVYTPNGKWCKN